MSFKTFTTVLFSILINGQLNAQKTKLATNYYLFVGTYTGKTSEGIYIYEFDSRTGNLTPVSVAKNIQNPSFLAVSADHKYLYSVSETDKGSVHSFSFDNKAGLLTKIGEQESMGAHPCFIDVDDKGKWAVITNYTGGNVVVFAIGSDGVLKPAHQNIKHEGKSINTARQEKPHPHSSVIASDGMEVIVPDLGIDKIMRYHFEAESWMLEPSKQAFVTMSPGQGPRHFTFHPNGKYAYVINELDFSITAFDYKNQELSQIQNISTLPKDYINTNYSCADIHISPDGKFLYGSNRGHESLVTFKINKKNGQLTYVENVSVQGKTPRNFMIDPSGKFVLVANQNTDNIAVFNRNNKTGKLSYTGKQITVSMPVCLQMIPKE